MPKKKSEYRNDLKDLVKHHIKVKRTQKYYWVIGTVQIPLYHP